MFYFWVFYKRNKKNKGRFNFIKKYYFNNNKQENEITEKEINNKQKNIIQIPSNEKTISINNKNEQEIALNEDSNKIEIQNIQKIKLENRTFFFYGEKLSQGEDQFTEFKDYPIIDKNLRQNLIKQYLGFLNSKDGFIYIGITDLKEVVGMKLNYKQGDIQRNDLVGF